jgi:hypothetical protein
MPKANLIAALLLCAFVIDRLVATIFFIGSYRKAEERSENNRKVVRFLFSALFAAVAIYLLGFLRVLDTVWPSAGQPNAMLDAVVTWLVLVAGAERLSSFVGDRGASAKPAEPAAPSQKLQVAGTLQLDDKSETVLRLQHT